MRRILLPVVAVAAGLTVATLVAEVLLRVLDLAAPGGVLTVNERDYAQIPGIFAPGKRVLDRSDPRFPHQVTINRLGYRDTREIPQPKPSGEFRILVAGDSFVFGALVDDAHTLPAALQEVLGERCTNVRVVNAGLGGSTIVDQQMLIRRGFVLSPDLVVLQFSENDVTDLGAPDSQWELIARNRAAKSRFPLSLVYPVLKESAIWHLGRKAAARWRARALPDYEVRAAEVEEAVPGSLGARYDREFAELVDTLRARGLPLVLAAFPSHHSVYDAEQRGQIAWLGDLAARRGVQLVDYTSALEHAALPDTALFFLPFDGHSRPVGYAIAARQLADVLMSRDELRSRCGLDSAGG